MSIQTTPQPTAEQVEALAGRIFMAGLEAVELYTVHMGIQLGLYRALDEGGAQTAASWRRGRIRSGATSASGCDTRPSQGSWAHVGSLRIR